MTGDCPTCGAVFDAFGRCLCPGRTAADTIPVELKRRTPEDRVDYLSHQLALASVKVEHLERRVALLESLVNGFFTPGMANRRNV